MTRIVYLPPLPGELDQEPLMRFRLIYDGALRSSQKDDGNHSGMASHKQSIRKDFHKQLRLLWQTNRFLREHEVYPTDTVTGRSPHSDAKQREGLATTARLPMVEAVAQQYRENGYRFVPLVRESISLLCGLNILFLRRDFPQGGVVSAGDIDNRVKTIIDALTKPLGSAQLGGIPPSQDEDPFFVLLENDKLVTSLAVETDALLSPPREAQHQACYARVIITVELRPYDVTMFNLGFAGN